MLGFCVLGAIPGILIMLFVDIADRKRPEPRWALRRVAIAGGVSFFFAVVIELLIQRLYKDEGILGALFQAYVMAALTEETLKMLAVRFFVWNRPELDERTDGIVYGARAGLGFAIVENVGYLLGTKGPVAFLGMFILRSALAVPMHAMAGAIMGHFGALRRFDRRGPGMLGGLVIAILMHGTYDAALFLVGVFAKDKHYGLVLAMLPIPIAIVGFGALALRRMWKSALADDDVASGLRRAGRLA